MRITDINESRPRGTTGIIIRVWNTNRIYAVAAEWAKPQGAVWQYRESRWEHTERQVRDFSSRPRVALLMLLEAEEPEDDPFSLYDLLRQALPLPY